MNLQAPMTETDPPQPRVQISKKLVLINSASSLVTRILSISVLIWLQQYLLRRITPEEYSLLPLLYSVMMFAPLVTTILTGGLGRYITIAYAKGDDDEVTRISSTMFPILCVAGLIFLAGGWTFAWYIGSVLSIAPERLWDARVMMAMLTLSAAIRLPLAPFCVGFHVRQKFVLDNLIGIGTEILRLTVLFALFFSVSTRVLWVITASVSAELLSLAVSTTISMRLVPAQRFKFSHIHWPIAKEIAGFGGWSLVAQLAYTIRTSADPIILNRLASPIDVATFHIGSLPMRHVQNLSLRLRGPLMPALTSFYATGQIDRLKSAYIRTARLNLQFYLGLAVPLFVFAPQIMSLYAGKRYTAASVIMQILLAFMILPYMCTLLPAIANIADHMRTWAIFNCVFNTFNVAITLLLVWRFNLGALGSALGTLVSGLLTLPYTWYLGLKILKIPTNTWLSRSVIPGLAPGTILAMVCYLLSWLAAPTTWFHLGLCTIIAVLLYVILLPLFLGDEDRRDISRVITQAYARVVSPKPAKEST